MRTQRSRGMALASISCQCLRRFRQRSRKKKEGMIRGKLRIRSIPGAFLILGMVVVVVGMALAVAGYWPYRAQRSVLGTVGDGLLMPSQASEWGVENKGLFSSSSLIHSDRMKLLGPVIMGVGLFILICANTVLYENRDRETQMMLAQMQSVICTVSTAVPTADMTSVNSLLRQYQWVSSLPAAHLNILCFQELPTTESLLLASPDDDDRPSPSGGVLHTQVLYHRESSSTSSIHSSNSRSLSTHPEHTDRARCVLEPHADNSRMVSSTSDLEEGDRKTNNAPHQRTNSVSYRTNPHAFKAVGTVRETSVQSVGSVLERSRPCSSDVCVSMLGANPPPATGQRHHSWPRLDLGYSMKYFRLENKDESVDTLLEQLEQECSQLDRSFGSGPF